MSQLVETTIDIGSVRIHQFSSLELIQSIAAHHTFKLVCPAEAIEGRSGKLFNQSQDLIGKLIFIKVTAVFDKTSLLFSGLVTKVEAARSSGHAGDVVISGYSPTILLDNGPHCKTWEEKGLSFILQDILRHFPANTLKTVVAPLSKESINYTVQYKETAWQFISRLAANHGEWLLYDGRQLIIGTPTTQQEATIPLTFGAQLDHLTLGMQLKPSQLQVQCYNYLENTTYKGSPKNIPAIAGLNHLGMQAFARSNEVYLAEPRQWSKQLVSNQRQLHELVNRQAAMHSSNMVRFTGVSDVPGIHPGSVISVKGNNLFNRQTEYYGEYTIIAASHRWDGLGNYTNEFEAVPATIKVPPVLPIPEPHCDAQSAVVIDNNDPDKLGRVRVKFHWMNGMERSPWLRLITQHAGAGKGMYMVPELNEEVFVAFECDVASRPYIMGSVYNGKSKTNFGNADNDIKAIQTRSGNKIVMNDKEGSVQIEDKDGNLIRIDGEGNIKCSSKSSMVFECGEASITLKKDGVIQIAGKSIEVTATNKAAVKSGGASFTANGQNNESVVRAGKSVVSGTREARLTSNANVAVDAGGTVKVEGALVTLN